MVLFVQHPEQILNLNNVCAYSLAKHLEFFYFTVTNHKKPNHKTLYYYIFF